MHNDRLKDQYHCALQERVKPILRRWKPMTSPLRSQTPLNLEALSAVGYLYQLPLTYSA
jgi:hypothetical protein